VLVDFFRRELAIDAEVLRETALETLKSRSAQQLAAPWALDEQESPQPARTLYLSLTGAPRPRSRASSSRCSRLAPSSGRLRSSAP